MNDSSYEHTIKSQSERWTNLNLTRSICNPRNIQLLFNYRIYIMYLTPIKYPCYEMNDKILQVNRANEWKDIIGRIVQALSLQIEPNEREMWLPPGHHLRAVWYSKFHSAALRGTGRQRSSWGQIQQHWQRKPFPGHNELLGDSKPRWGWSKQSMSMEPGRKRKGRLTSLTWMV